MEFIDISNNFGIYSLYLANKKIMKFLFALFLTFNLSAQIGTGEWRLHVPNKSGIDVVVGNNIVYTAFESGLMEYDIASSEISLWTKVNSLSDISLTCLEYYNAQSALYVGYENGNLDKIVNNKVTNIPAIRLAEISGSKRINKILSYNNFIYVSTGFSIVKIDPIKDEVRDTYYPTNGEDPILDVSFRNDSIFALTSSKLYRGLIESPALADPSQWVIDSRLATALGGNSYREIEMINDNLFVFSSNPLYGMDSVYHITNAGTTLIQDPLLNLEIKSLENLNGKLAVNLSGGIYIYSSDFSSYTIETIISGNGIETNNSFYDNGIYWIADNENGLTRYYNGGGLRIGFQGPVKNNFYTMDCDKGKLLIAGGGLAGHQMTYNSTGMHVFENEEWFIKDAYNQDIWVGKNIWDFLCVAVNPTDKNKMAVGTFSETALSLFTDGNQVSEIFTVSNSPLEPTIWNPEAMITDIEYDETGNLWIANSYCLNPLKVYTKENTWQTLSLGGVTTNKVINQIEIDYNGNKWLAVGGVGLVALNDNKTISVLTDDKVKVINSAENSGALPSNEITALAVDFNNEIWIGTDNGFAILYNSSAVFDAANGSYNAQRIKIDVDGNVEYLLGNTYITDIEVDGANRKWFGTESAGIFLLSDDGTEILQNFTAENSPLISNNIMDMQLDQSTGELYIATDKGLVSYRTDATYEDPEYSNVKVFPNPVKPDFFGQITIQGIKYDSDIHVTDVAGNLVYKTTSNGGTATWDGKTLLGDKVKSGVYLFWTAPNVGKGRKVGKVVVIN